MTTSVLKDGHIHFSKYLSNYREVGWKDVIVILPEHMTREEFAEFLTWVEVQVPITFECWYGFDEQATRNITPDDPQ